MTDVLIVDVMENGIVGANTGLFDVFKCMCILYVLFCHCLTYFLCTWSNDSELVYSIDTHYLAVIILENLSHNHIFTIKIIGEAPASPYPPATICQQHWTILNAKLHMVSWKQTSEIQFIKHKFISLVSLNERLSYRLYHLYEYVNHTLCRTYLACKG